MGGGDFTISYERNHTQFIKKRKREGFAIVHLTMYGIKIRKMIDALAKASPRPDKILIVVGSEAVPPEVYQLADYNVSVTSQPHSEVAALAITLDQLMDGTELERDDFLGEIRIEPSERGKKVVKR